MHKLISLLILLTFISPTIVSSASYNEELCRIKDELLQPQHWDYTKDEEFKSDSLLKSFKKRISEKKSASHFVEDLTFTQRSGRKDGQNKLPIYFEKALLQIVLDTTISEDYREAFMWSLGDFASVKYLDLYNLLSTAPSLEIRKNAATFSFRIGEIDLTKKIIKEINDGGNVFFIHQLNKNSQMKAFLEMFIREERNINKMLFFLKVHALEFNDEDFVTSHLNVIDIVLAATRNSKNEKIKKKMAFIRLLLDPSSRANYLPIFRAHKKNTRSRISEEGRKEILKLVGVNSDSTSTKKFKNTFNNSQNFKNKKFHQRRTDLNEATKKYHQEQRLKSINQFLEMYKKDSIRGSKDRRNRHSHRFSPMKNLLWFNSTDVTSLDNFEGIHSFNRGDSLITAGLIFLKLPVLDSTIVDRSLSYFRNYLSNDERVFIIMEQKQSCQYLLYSSLSDSLVLKGYATVDTSQDLDDMGNYSKKMVRDKLQILQETAKKNKVGIWSKEGK